MSTAARRWAVLLALAALHPACVGSGDSSWSSSGGVSSPPSAVLSVANTTATTIRLSWTNPSSSSGTPQSLYSTIFRDGSKLTETSGFSYVDDGLPPNSSHTYSVVVTAVYWFISSTSSHWRSNTVTAATLSDAETPSIPSQLSALALSESEIKLTWIAAGDNDRVSVYAIYRDGSLQATTAGLSYLDTGLAATTTYTYAVAARDPSGNESALSDPASAKTLAQADIIDATSSYNSSMALDSTGSPHLVYTVRTGDFDYELRHATRIAGPWVKELLSPSWHADPSLVVDSFDRIHVAVKGVYLNNKAGTWAMETLPEKGGYPSIAVEPGGAVHIGHLVEISVAGYTDRRVNYVTNGTGSWVSETLDTTFGYSYPVVAWGGNRIHLTRCTGQTSKPQFIHHGTRESGAWAWSMPEVTVTSDGSPYTGLRPSMVVDAAGTVHLAIRNIYATRTAGVWTWEVYDSQGSCPTLALDASQKPQLLYNSYDPVTESHYLQVAKRGPAGWSRQTVARVVQPAFYLALGIDATGARHISYSDGRIAYLRIP